MGGGAAGQLRGLFEGARFPQAAQQGVYAVRVVEGGVGGRVPGQQRGLLARARLPHTVQQLGRAVRYPVLSTVVCGVPDLEGARRQGGCLPGQGGQRLVHEKPERTRPLTRFKPHDK